MKEEVKVTRLFDLLERLKTIFWPEKSTDNGEHTVVTNTQTSPIYWHTVFLNWGLKKKIK